MTTESLSKMVFQPKGNADGNGLQESVLGQVASNSVMLFDETAMEAGKLDGKAIDNIKAIGQLVEEQQINFDFQYYQTQLPTNIACLFVGTGRSIFKNTLHLPLQPQDSKTFDKVKYLEVLNDKETMQQLRTLMLVGNKSVIVQSSDDFNIPDEVAEHIQAVFCQKKTR